MPTEKKQSKVRSNITRRCRKTMSCRRPMTRKPQSIMNRMIRNLQRTTPRFRMTIKLKIQD